ncbi:MAG: branched-chain amino acid ABC transporter permease [Acetobacteraceae bacterium]
MIALYGGATALILGIGFAAGPYWVQLAIGVAISALLALSWDVLSRAGLVSLGTAGFFGLGSYSSALLADPLGAGLAWVCTVPVCALVAMALGLITLRLRRMYFAIATLAFALALQVVVLIAPDLTGGAGGISPTVIFGGDPRFQLLLIGAFLLAALGISDVLLTPRFRPAFFVIRVNPDLAAASGVPVVRAKVLAFMVSGVIAGLAGASYGGLYGYVVPADVFTLNWSVLPLAVTVLGGMDTTTGPLLGAILLRALEEAARATVGGVGYQVVYGAVIIGFVLLMPSGIVGLVHRLRQRPRTVAGLART